MRVFSRSRRLWTPTTKSAIQYYPLAKVAQVIAQLCAIQFHPYTSFQLFCIRFVKLDELTEFNWNLLRMTHVYWKLFCVPNSQLAVWCNSYDVRLMVSILWVQASQKSFWVFKFLSSIINVRKRSCQKVMFFSPVCQSFCSQGGLPQCMLGYNPPPRAGTTLL